MSTTTRAVMGGDMVMKVSAGPWVVRSLRAGVVVRPRVRSYVLVARV
jgi:hypothetical protein